ncbi:hypothetical protein ACLB6G_20790, partial [Zhengella sp. ZM62]|uniref:hypothetical protein n=1 Tax=Zhengella sedimenti TaxID=3390035 RepID=UPI003975C04A
AFDWTVWRDGFLVVLLVLKAAFVALFFDNRIWKKEKRGRQVLDLPCGSSEEGLRFKRLWRTRFSRQLRLMADLGWSSRCECSRRFKRDPVAAFLRGRFTEHRQPNQISST